MKFLVVLIFSFTTLAVPKSLDVIFLAPKKTSLNTRKFEIPNKTLKVLSQNDIKEKCQPMGEGCFHPQLGYIGKNGNDTFVEKEDERGTKLKTFNSDDVQLVDCKEGSYFDIFCGKAQDNSHGPIDYEVWIDTSSSMRRVDFSTDSSFCSRRSFIERFKKKCDLEINTFDTSMKQLGGLGNLCINYGLNNTEKIIKWIERSSAKKLVIVTDIDEANKKLRDYLFKVGANIHGADHGEVSNEKLLPLLETFTKNCKTKN